jgi:hypothetical protein
MCRLSLLMLFSVFWLIPLFWMGAAGRGPIRLPPWLALQYGLSGLFTKRVSTWTQILVQVQRGTSSRWETLKMSEFSPLGAFGYRQRLDRLLQDALIKPPAAASVQVRLASWIAARDAVLHPGAPQVSATRIRKLIWRTGSPELTQPGTHWIPNPPAIPTHVSIVDSRPRYLDDDQALRRILQSRASKLPVEESPSRPPNVFRRQP